MILSGGRRVSQKRTRPSTPSAAPRWQQEEHNLSQIDDVVLKSPSSSRERQCLFSYAPLLANNEIQLFHYSLAPKAPRAPLWKANLFTIRLQNLWNLKLFHISGVILVLPILSLWMALRWKSAQTYDPHYSIYESVTN